MVRVGVVVKLWLYVAAAIMLSGFIGYGIHIVKKANRADAAEARADAAEAGRAKDMREVVRRLDESEKERQRFLQRFDDIEKRFDGIKIPPPQALVNNREVPSVEGKCIAPTVGSEFVGVWNAASEP